MLNDVLVEKVDLELLVKENDVINVSSKLPGLIVQSYLVLVELFNLDVMAPLERVKIETIEGIRVLLFFLADQLKVGFSDLSSDLF